MRGHHLGTSSHVGRLCAIALLFALIAIAVPGCSGAATEAPVDTDNMTADELIDTVSQEVSVFYPASDTVIEDRVVLDDETDALFQVLTLMFEADTLPSGAKVTLPPAEVLGVSIEDGLATIDFSADVLGTGESAQVQQVALVSIIYAATQFPEVDRVAFTVEGRTDGTIDGKDIATFWGDVTLKDMPWSATVDAVIEEGNME